MKTKDWQLLQPLLYQTICDQCIETMYMQYNVSETVSSLYLQHGWVCAYYYVTILAEKGGSGGQIIWLRAFLVSAGDVAQAFSHWFIWSTLWPWWYSWNNVDCSVQHHKFTEKRVVDLINSHVHSKAGYCRKSPELQMMAITSLVKVTRIYNAHRSRIEIEAQSLTHSLIPFKVH